MKQAQLESDVASMGNDISKLQKVTESPEVKSTMKPVKKRPCVFPFQYKGVTYYQCTSVDHSRPWCGTERKPGGWRNC